MILQRKNHNYQKSIKPSWQQSFFMQVSHQDWGKTVWFAIYL
jgi:hypothetical protein